MRNTSEEQNSNIVKMCQGQEELMELHLVKSWCSANVDAKQGRANAKKFELKCVWNVPEVTIHLILLAV